MSLIIATLFVLVAVIADVAFPANVVADKVPVLGTNDNLVDDIFSGKLPLVPATQVGYTETAVVTSSVMATLFELVDVVAVTEFPVHDPLDPVTLPVTFPVTFALTKVAVIFLAAKSPLVSLVTIALTVFTDVAVVAVLDTLPVEDIVANLVSAILAPVDISPLTIKELDIFPTLLLCNTPADVNSLIDNVPEELIVILSDVLVEKDSAFEFKEIPVPVCPLKVNDGAVVEPIGNINGPVIVSPVFKTFAEEAPVIAAVMVPAVKFPLASLATIPFATFKLLAVVAEFDTFPADDMVANFVSDILASLATSLLDIKDDVKLPFALL